MRHASYEAALVLCDKSPQLKAISADQYSVLLTLGLATISASKLLSFVRKAVRFTVPGLSFNVLTSLALAPLLAMIISVPMAQFRHRFFAFGDLRVFYCSASVARAGFDPYRVEPIGACERALVGMQQGNFVVPAPLPGHAIAFFDPLARLPFAVVAVIWCALMTSVFFALSIMLTRLTKWPYIYTLITLLPLAFVIPIFRGQLVSIAITLVVTAALALRSKYDGAAALLAAAATIEPHIGLPVCAAVFLNRPRTRPLLLLAAVTIAAITMHTVGLHGLFEYVQRVLPEHIASEARYDEQYSLTYLLTWLHLPVRNAIAIGQCSYWLLAAAGIGAAIRLSGTLGDVRFLLFVPMAFSVIGGPYVHEEHLLAAIPLAILLVATARTRARVLLTIAVALVAWPAKLIAESLDIPGMVMSIDTASVSKTVGPLPQLAEAAWAARIEPNAGHLMLLAAKFPSWIGLLILLAATALRVYASMRLTLN